MEVIFNYHEALLGLTSVISWADGKNQEAEKDARVKMIMEEKIPETTLDTFKGKYGAFKSYEELFSTCITTLKQLETDKAAKACAWMKLMAIISKNSTESNLDYYADTWKQQQSNIDSEEMEWVEKACEALSISKKQMNTQFQTLPNIQRI